MFYRLCGKCKLDVRHQLLSIFRRISCVIMSAHLPKELPASPETVDNKNLTDDHEHGLKRKDETPGHNLSRPKRCKQDFKTEKYEDTDYYFENGLRKVYPYYFTYTTFCKGRWLGRKLLDVFAEEFRAFKPEDYRKKIESGSITVNGQLATSDTVLRDNDLIESKVHRHEVPVLASPMTIIHDSDEILVIDKPPSLPVHPCGRYRHNSVVFILGKELNIKDLHVVHRLDRLTSGLLLLGKTTTKARQLMKEISGRAVSKEYICRVEGNFPDEPVTVEEPIEVLSHKIGICCVGPNGKSAKTEFKKLSYNNKSSVLLCKPLTGRTHQIRVHLQFLGFPIINDPMYNSHVFGPNKGKGGEFGKPKEQVIKEIIQAHNIVSWFEDQPVKNNAEQASCSSSKVCSDATTSKKSDTSDYAKLSCALAHYINQPAYHALCDKYKYDPSRFVYDETCFDCRNKCRDPEPDHLIMLLHAFRYKGEDWEFKTQMPVWADEKWNIL